jgi:hypothetical protein
LKNVFSRLLRIHSNFLLHIFLDFFSIFSKISNFEFKNSINSAKFVNPGWSATNLTNSEEFIEIHQIRLGLDFEIQPIFVVFIDKLAKFDSKLHIPMDPKFRTPPVNF